MFAHTQDQSAAVLHSLAHCFPHIPRAVVRQVLLLSNSNEVTARATLANLLPSQIRQLEQHSRQHNDPHQHSCEQFVQITGSTQRQAAEVLAQNRWDLSEALRVFYTHDDAHPSTALRDLFLKYKQLGVDAGGDETLACIQGEGVVSFFQDLGVDPYSDLAPLVVAWVLQCRDPYTIGEDEFLCGLAARSCDSIASIAAALPAWRAAAETQWREFYEFSFEWSRPTQQKYMDCAGALDLWTLLFKDSHAWTRLDDWREFMTTETPLKSVSRDVWRQMRTFAQHAHDFSDYDLDVGAWPCVFDEFVVHILKKEGKYVETD